MVDAVRTDEWEDKLWTMRSSSSWWYLTLICYGRFGTACGSHF